MADQTLLLPSPDTLTSPTLDLYDASTRALVEAGLELEEGGIPHVYEVTRTGSESGIHVAILSDGASFAGLWVVDLADASGDYVLTWASNWGVLKATSGLSTLDAAGIRAAVGLGAASLDGQLLLILSGLSGLQLASGTLGIGGNDPTHVNLSALTYGDDEINDCLLIIMDADPGEYHARWVEDWAAGTKLATVAALPFTPTGSEDEYFLMPARRDVLTAAERNAIADAHLGRVNAIAGNTTPAEALRRIGASAAGQVSGAGTGTEVFRDFAGVVCLTVLADDDGNRTSVVYA